MEERLSSREAEQAVEDVKERLLGLKEYL